AADGRPQAGLRLRHDPAPEGRHALGVGLGGLVLRRERVAPPAGPAHANRVGRLAPALVAGLPHAAWRVHHFAPPLLRAFGGAAGGIMSLSMMSCSTPTPSAFARR